MPRAPSLTTLSSSHSLASMVQERGGVAQQLTIQSGMKNICAAMQRQDSGLEVRDRMWLKITIPQVGSECCPYFSHILFSQAFIGSDVVSWLYSHVFGFTERREAPQVRETDAQGWLHQAH